MSGFTHEAPGGGATVEWYTPAWIFLAIGLLFDLDPCHPRRWLPWVPAYERYSLPEDGLALPWFGRVWLNPPYGPETTRWLAKMHEHRNGVALVFSRTDCAWFHKYVVQADAVCFMRKRVQFVDAEGKVPLKLDKRSGKMRPSSPGAGSILVAWGEENVQALERSGLGYVVRNPQQAQIVDLVKYAARSRERRVACVRSLKAAA